MLIFTFPSDRFREVFDLRGTVKFFDERKNYGFIEPDEEAEDRFVHASEVETGTLNEGDIVEFDPEMGDKGPKAINVRKIE
ncbi:hypothetical protein AKJ40_02135 [candidate division MSBL1 archaeon SCGC-AAA259M10]|uniref:CSD domain-containing protein n=2 Tax=candidate division MSBL1 TaxID=215777 RepID=A0A133U5T4_9EURY|nr:hypothetical protein AKJ62_02935 [candidate division MSBL1 archaeon SCGC-AAA259D14]KXA99973.1 hypothetical protein AKJ40_02135 [candidate division MSBL1 archaeon SCGC-AAA259M10]